MIIYKCAKCGEEIGKIPNGSSYPDELKVHKITLRKVDFPFCGKCYREIIEYFIKECKEVHYRFVTWPKKDVEWNRFYSQM